MMGLGQDGGMVVGDRRDRRLDAAAPAIAAGVASDVVTGSGGGRSKLAASLGAPGWIGLGTG